MEPIPASRPQLPDALRIAFLGIGNDLNGDDAAGVQVVHLMRRHLDRRHVSVTVRGSTPVFIFRDGSLEILLLEGGAAPEAFTGPLRRFMPDWVVLVDAASFDAPPGTVTWLNWAEAEGMSASTHTLPPTILSSYLMKQLSCQIALVGIQPQALEFDTPMSPVVARAVKSAARQLATLLEET